MSFGGTVKLTGETDYRRALSAIQSDLKALSAEMKTVSSAYDKNDQSMAAVTARSKNLKDTLDAQLQKLVLLSKQQEEYEEAMEADAKALIALDEAIKQAQKKLDDMAESTETTTEEYHAQEAVLEDLRNKYDAVEGELIDNKKGYNDLRTEVANTQTDINNTTKKLDELGNEAEDSAKQAKEASSKDGGWSMLKQVLADLATKGVELAISALKDLGKMLFDIGKEAVASYAEYEQLSGGMETFFKDSSDTVHQYAAEAYKTAGISANEYLSQVTGFSAKLISDLSGDTGKAADLADLAIKDMADNASQFGTDLSSIQNAYQGFAKQNFNMLDNLRLGYSGNAEEMARLINDTKVLGEEITVDKETVKDVPFDKIIEAIHITQENLGIAGNTAKEAGDTISGSAKTVKAAWGNLLVGMADDTANFDELIENLISSVMAFANNIIPRIQTTITGLSTALTGLVGEILPQIIAILPDVIDSTLPIVLEAVEKLLGSVIEALPSLVSAVVGIIPSLIQALTRLIPVLLQAGFDIVKTVLSGVKDALPVLLSAIPPLVKSVVEIVIANIGDVVNLGLEIVNALLDGLFEALPVLLEALPDLINGLVEALIALTPVLTDAVILFCQTWVQEMPALVETLEAVIGALLTGLFEILYRPETQDLAFNAIGKFVEMLFDLIPVWFESYADNWFGLKMMLPIFNAFIAGVKMWWSAGTRMLEMIWEGILSVKDWFVENFGGFFTEAWNKVQEIWGVVAGWFKEKVFDPIIDKFRPIITFFKEAWAIIKDLATIAWAGIKAAWEIAAGWYNEHVITPVKKWFSDLWNGVKNAASNAWEALKTGALSAWEGIKKAFAPVAEWFKTVFSDAWTKVKNVFSIGGKIFEGIKTGIENAFKSIVNAFIRGINRVIAIPFNNINNMLDKVRSIEILGIAPFKGLLHRFTVPQIPQLAQGGVLKKGQIGLLEGSGAEAVVPLENNTRWIKKIAQELQENGGGGITVNMTINGAPNQSVNELAEVIAVKIQKMATRREAAFA